jgi:hypothetical protein
MVGIIKTSTKQRGKKKFASAAAAQAERERQESWAKLQARHAAPLGLSAKARVKVAVTSEDKSRLPKGSVSKPDRQFSTPHVQYGTPDKLPTPAPKLATHLKYSGDMLEREHDAQKKIEARKKMVAPAYNKGGLQLITNPEDFKTMGRKT